MISAKEEALKQNAFDPLLSGGIRCLNDLPAHMHETTTSPTLPDMLCKQHLVSFDGPPSISGRIKFSSRVEHAQPMGCFVISVKSQDSAVYTHRPLLLGPMLARWPDGTGKVLYIFLCCIIVLTATCSRLLITSKQVTLRIRA